MQVNRTSRRSWTAKALGTALLALMAACSNGHDKGEGGSELMHLTPNMPQCAVDEARAKELYQALAPYTSGPQALTYYLAQQVSSLPAPYTDYLVKRARGGALRLQTNAALGAGVAGLTTGGFDGTEPMLIQFPGSQELIRQAALHEFGHALQSFAFRNAEWGPQEAAMTNQALQRAMSAGDAQYMWEYARTNRYEYWASAFSQYYCSGSSRNTMQRTFPSTYGFMASVLSKAENKLGVGLSQKPGTQGGAVPGQSSTNKPASNGDADGDGIPDSEDFCDDTPKGAQVYKTGMYRGCAPGQKAKAMPGSANGDDDGDGVRNYYDVCPNTPKGATIHTSGEYMGCATGQSTIDLPKARMGE